VVEWQGCAASIALARKGRGVTLIEREPTPRHKVCGEFLSGEALEDLHALGIDVASLGAVPIDYVRLAAARRAAEAPLPFPAASLTRKALDTALFAEAVAAGVRVEQGRSVQSLSRTTANVWQLRSMTARPVKPQQSFSPQASHDIRGHTRPKDPEQWVAFKMYFRLAPAQAAELADASELMLYPGGYGGIQPVKAALRTSAVSYNGGIWHVRASLGKLPCEDATGLSTPSYEACRCGAAAGQADRHHPYPVCYIRRTTKDGLYCIGDQAAVIPRSPVTAYLSRCIPARCAAAAYLAAEPAPLFQAKLRSSLLSQMRLAEFAADGLNNSLSRAVLPFCLRVWPGVMRVTAGLTRVAQHSPVAPQAVASRNRATPKQLS